MYRSSIILPSVIVTSSEDIPITPCTVSSGNTVTQQNAYTRLLNADLATITVCPLETAVTSPFDTVAISSLTLLQVI